METAKKINKSDRKALTISKRGRPPKDHQLLVEAMLYRIRVGCPWRDLPHYFGAWASVYTRWWRWNRTGLWQSVLKVVARKNKGRLRFLDASHIKIHQDASNPVGGQSLQAMGRTKGGLNTKLSALVDVGGRAVQLLLNPGQQADVTAAKSIRTQPGTTVVADKGYDSNPLRAQFARQGASTSICPKKSRLRKVTFNSGYYRLRHRVENLFQRMKRFRGIGTRYDKSDIQFSGSVHLIAVIDWLKFRF